MRNILIFLLTAPLFAVANYQSIQGATGQYGTINFPNLPIWNNLSIVRIEFRLHNWTNTGRIFQGAGLLCTKNTNDVTCADFYDANSPTSIATIPAGATDIIVRVQRNSTMFVVELWRADGSEKSQGQFYAISASSFSLGNTSLAVLHNGGGGSTGVPAGLAWLRMYSTATVIDSPMPTNIVGGDLLDYELEGTGADASVNGLTMALTGPPTFPSTPVVPMVGFAVSLRAGATFMPNCNGTAADAYKWRQQGIAPLVVNFSNVNLPNPTITGIGQFGQYNLTCTATINGVSATSTLIVGAVPTNAAGVVMVADSIISQLLGPMLQNSISEWSWYDSTRVNKGDYWYTTTAGYTNDFAAPSAENYYDACLAQYQNYYRTGFTRFLTYARACSDKWYTQYWAALASAGTCASNIAPREASFVGMALRAYETNELAGGLKWTCLTAYADFQFNNYLEIRGIDEFYTSPYFGVRESGYALIHAVAVAVSHPTLSVRAAYGARVTTELTNYVRGLQCQTGTVFQACTDNYTVPTGTLGLTAGSTAVTGTGTAFLSFFANGNGIAIGDFVSDNTYYYTVTRTTDTSLTLSAPYAGANNTGVAYAKRDSTNAVTGNWRWGDAITDLIGYGSEDWHTGILIEGVIRAHSAGFGKSVAATIITSFNDYLLTNIRPYPAQTCTGAFNNIQSRRIVYSVYYGQGDYGTGCSNDSDIANARQQNSLVAATHGFTYLITGAAAALARGNDIWSATYGSWTGTGADGGKGLGDATMFNSNGKFYGQTFRDGSFLVHRLGATAADITPIPVNFSFKANIADIPTATAIRATLVKPDGTSSIVTCTIMPCVLVGDRAQGTSVQLSLEYLNSGGQVRSSGLAVAASIQ